jgi:hypothetical protein
MVKGHLDQARQIQRSKQKGKPQPNQASPIAPPPGFPDKATPGDTTDEDFFPASSKPNDRTHLCCAAMLNPTGKVFLDQTGRFVIPSSVGSNYLVIV